MKNKLDKIAINNSDGTTKQYVNFKDYKREISARDSKIKTLELKLEEKAKKHYKIGDEVKYCSLDWYVIFVNEDKVTLMLKNKLNKEQLNKCGYNPDSYNDIVFNSDHSNNDWLESNARKCVIEFANKYLNVEDLISMKSNYDEDKYSEDYIRIPLLREIEKLPKDIRKVDAGSGYWTMTASYGATDTDSYARVFFVTSNGDLYYNYVYSAYGVRPVITLKAETL